MPQRPHPARRLVLPALMFPALILPVLAGLLLPALLLAGIQLAGLAGERRGVAIRAGDTLALLVAPPPGRGHRAASPAMLAAMGWPPPDDAGLPKP